MISLSTTNKLKSLTSDSMVTITDEQLRQLQRVLLQIMNDIAQYCAQHGLRYSLGGGSALGAVRHHGFIPWDDDADVDMPRADYNTFLKGFTKQYKEKYSVFSPELTPQSGLTAARVRLKGTKCGLIDDYNNEDCGIYVDVVPVENAYDNSFRRWWHGMRCMVVGLLFSCRRFYRDCEFYLNFGREDAEFIKAAKIKIAIGRIASCKSMEWWSRTLVKTYSQCKNEQSEYVVVPAGRGHYCKEIYRRDGVVETRKELFEGTMFDVPKDAEGYLTHHYGEWKRIPDSQHRERHAYLCLDFGKYGSNLGLGNE